MYWIKAMIIIIITIIIIIAIIIIIIIMIIVTITLTIIITYQTDLLWLFSRQFFLKVTHIWVITIGFEIKCIMVG